MTVTALEYRDVLAGERLVAGSPLVHGSVAGTLLQ